MGVRGGKREGAGRKPGALNKVTAEARIKAAETGITPLEYMLEVLRAPVPPQLEQALKDNPTLADTVVMLSNWHEKRMDAAKAAAPYLHPRLSTNVITGPNNGPLQVEIKNYALPNPK